MLDSLDLTLVKGLAGSVWVRTEPALVPARPSFSWCQVMGAVAQLLLDAGLKTPSCRWAFGGEPFFKVLGAEE